MDEDLLQLACKRTGAECKHVCHRNKERRDYKEKFTTVTVYPCNKNTSRDENEEQKSVRALYWFGSRACRRKKKKNNTVATAEIKRQLQSVF